MNTKKATPLSLALIALLLASCGNIDIVKRTYRKGYHVDVVKKNKRQVNQKNDSPDLNLANYSKENVADEPKGIIPEKNTSENKTYSFSDGSVALATVESETHILSEKEVVRMNRAEIRKAENNFIASEVKRSDFHWVNKKNANYKTARKATAPLDFSNAHWSDWTVFGVGVGAATFGIIGLIVSFFGYTLWPVPIVLGIAAIVLYFIAKSKGWSSNGSMQKFGFIMGIVGAGLGILSIIFWAVIGRSGRWYRRRW